MCDECRRFAESMVRSAMTNTPENPVGYRAPTEVIAKSNFKVTRLPTDMSFTHACGRTVDEVRKSDGFDPAYSSEICYSNDSGPHEHWFDRMTFAAKAQEGRVLSKVADMQGYGTDRKGEGTQYAYKFTAPRGTQVRSTRGKFDGEICFPEPIPWSWIDEVHEVQIGKGHKKNYVVKYKKASG